MATFLTRVLNISNSNFFLPGLHWVAKAYFKRRGYVWEVRRNGEMSLGLWRLSFRKRNQKNAYPKRFIVVPGLGDTSISWYGVLVLLTPLLRRQFDEVILIDFPGFGGFLSKEKSYPSFDLMMTTLNDTLDALKPHTVLGHSLGAWLTAHYAGLCGEEKRPLTNRLNYSGPDTLILTNPSGIFANQETKLTWIALFQTVMNEGFSILRPHLFIKEPAWFPWILPHFKEFFAREDIIQLLRSVGEEHAVDRIVSHVKSNVWLIWGERDTLIPAICAEAWLKSLNSNFRDRHHAVILKNAGHSPHIEKPGVTAAVIAQILTQKPPRLLDGRWWKVLKPAEVCLPEQ